MCVMYVGSWTIEAIIYLFGDESLNIQAVRREHDTLHNKSIIVTI